MLVMLIALLVIVIKSVGTEVIGVGCSMFNWKNSQPNGLLWAWHDYQTRRFGDWHDVYIRVCESLKESLFLCDNSGKSDMEAYLHSMAKNLSYWTWVHGDSISMA